MRFKPGITLGEVTILVNVPGLPYTNNSGFTLLTLTGTIVGETDIPRHHDDLPPIVFPKKIEVKEEEEFIIVRVSDSILPNGFPLTKADLATDVAINVDYIILILPAAVSDAVVATD